MTVGAARTPLALFIELLASFGAVAVFVAIFGQGDGPAPSFVAIAAVVLGSFALARALQMTDLEQEAMRIIGLTVSIIALLVIARIEYAPGEWLWDPGWFTGLFTDTSDTIRPNAHVIAGVVALVPLWLRGVMRGQAAIEFDSVLTSASLGMLAVIIATLATPDTREAVSWGAFALVYAAAALLTLALFQAPEPEASIARFARRWTSAGALFGGGAVAVAMLTAAIDPGAFGYLAPIGEPLRFVGSLLGTYVLGPIFWLLFQPFRLFGWLLGQIFPPGDPIPPPREELLADPEQREPGEQPLWWKALVWAMGISAFAVILAVTTLLLWFAFRRFARQRGRDARERRESIEPASSLAADLGDLMGAIARRLRRTPRAQNAVQIRRLYFEMLDAAQARGLDRPLAATPLQFAPSLDAYFASTVPSSISRAFAESRYGERAIDTSVVRDLRERWRGLRGASTDSADSHG